MLLICIGSIYDSISTWRNSSRKASMVEELQFDEGNRPGFKTLTDQINIILTWAIRSNFMLAIFA
jgi:hypothetical protein